MPNLYAQETYINRTLDRMIGESDVTETFTDNPGELYRCLMAEYGRCTGKVYVDSADGPRAIGWVFVKRMVYEDSRNGETYLREVWVTLHDSPDTTPARISHYHTL